MKHDFESCGEHLRNLITPYCTLLEILKSLKRHKEEGNEDKFNKVLNFLMRHDLITSMISLSFQRLIKWRKQIGEIQIYLKVKNRSDERQKL